MRSTSRIVVLAIALGLLGSVIPAPAGAASITVNSLGDAAADDGSCTLREAITAANTDTASGASVGECIAGSGADAIAFTVSGTITVYALPAIESDLSISGAGAIAVDGATCSVLHIAGGTVSLAGLIVTGGTCIGFGAGGIGGDVGTGAGVRNGGTLTITNSTIRGNSAVLGGGGILNVGTLVVANSTISGNSAGFGAGGGIDNVGVLTITSSTLSGNSADGGGGGISNGNVARSGTLTLANSTISGNSAGAGGGGIYNFAGTLTVTNSTISGNSAGASGGGIFAAGSENLVNAIVAGNSAPIDPDVSSVTVETITTSVIGVPAGKTLADILDPAGLANNGGATQTIALALVAGNPAVDTGTAAACAAAPVDSVDQRGLPRPAACDIGAYEAQLPIPTPTARPAPLPNTATVNETTEMPGLPAAVAVIAMLSAVALGRRAWSRREARLRS